MYFPDKMVIFDSKTHTLFMIKRICEVCNNEFYSQWKKIHKYCSYECREIVRKRKLAETKIKQEQTGVIHGKTFQQYLYEQYKKQAAKKGKAFELSYEYYSNNLWQKPCYYCASSIPKVGIGRIDSSVGYADSNCVPSCPTCNLMKSRMSKSDFIDRCKLIATRFT